MTRLVLSDALIREALSPAPHTTAPAGLLAQITAEVARTPQHRTLRLPQLPQSRRLAWVLVAAATLLVLLGALVVAGGSRNPLLALLFPTPSPLPQELRLDLPVEIEAVSADEAWVAESGIGPRPRLWHRTAAGWVGPVEVGGVGTVTGLARLPDGRLVVGTSAGTWVGRPDAWTRISERGALEVEVDGTGAVWVTEYDGWTAEGLHWYREIDGAWETGAADCPAGGLDIAIGADGSIWTAGYRDGGGMHGLARLQDTCAEVFPVADGDISYDIAVVTSGAGGGVAAAVMEPRGTERAWPAGRIMAWDGAAWTEIRHGSDVAGIASDGLAYGPDGAIWASVNGRLSRYEHAAWSEGRDILHGSPLAVAPDGAVWFLADPVTGRGLVDRLDPGEAPVGRPAPTPLAQQLPLEDSAIAVEIEGVSAEEAWASDRGALWHRTAAGWAGPIVPQGTREDAVRDLARMPDGRIVFSTDLGIWVGDEQGWTQVARRGGGGVAVDGSGVIWAGNMSGDGNVRTYRETDGAWHEESFTCGAGGFLVAAASAGSAWTAGIGYSGSAGVARLEAGTCGEVQPWGDGMTHDVVGIATDGANRVAIAIMELQTGDEFPYGRVMAWDGSEWTTLREAVEVRYTGFNGLSYGPDGTLWAAFGRKLWAYAGGVETAVRQHVGLGPVSVAPDGTVWFVAQDPESGAEFVDRLLPAGDTAAPGATTAPQSEPAEAPGG